VRLVCHPGSVGIRTRHVPESSRPIPFHRCIERLVNQNQLKTVLGTFNGIADEDSDEYWRVSLLNPLQVPATYGNVLELGCFDLRSPGRVPGSAPRYGLYIS